jgi:integrase
MSLFLRGNIWWMEIKGPDGKLVRESTKMRDRPAAERVQSVRKLELHYGMQPADQGKAKSLKDALDRWYTERADKRSISDDRQRGAFWLEKLGDLPLKLVTADRIKKAINAKQKQDGLSNATCNRYLALIRAVLRACVIDWGWLDKAPSLRLAREEPGPARYLTEEQIDQLEAALPAHLRDVFRFALATGLRLENVIGLKWDWVSLRHKTLSIPSSEYKSGRRHTIPLGPTAVRVIEAREGQHPDYVFVHKGERYKGLPRYAWHQAREAIGMPNLRWHDLRHTFASHHMMNGTPAEVLQVLGGWKSANMVQRYAHLAPDYLAKYSANSPG